MNLLKPNFNLMILGLQLKKKPYIVEYLNNIKLSRSQYTATYSIKYGPRIKNMYALEKFAYKFHQQLVNMIDSRLPIKDYKDILMPTYNQILRDRYNATAFLIR